MFNNFIKPLCIAFCFAFFMSLGWLGDDYIQGIPFDRADFAVPFIAFLTTFITLLIWGER